MLNTVLAVVLFVSTALLQSGVRGWVQVLEVKGSASKQTDLFDTTGTKWRIRWHKQSAEHSLHILIYDKAGELVDAVSTTSTGSDESYVHKKGSFYLSINTSGPYVVMVEDWR